MYSIQVNQKSSNVETLLKLIHHWKLILNELPAASKRGIKFVGQIQKGSKLREFKPKMVGFKKLIL